MSVPNWEIRPVNYQLKTNWAISRNSSTEKINYQVWIDNKLYSEFAPNIRFGETHEKIKKEIDILKSISHKFITLKLCLEWCDDSINQNQWSKSFIAGIEMAALDYFDGYDFYLPGLEKICVTSMSTPIMELDEFKDFYQKFNCAQFKNIKLKSAKKVPLEIIEYLNTVGKHYISIDFNEALNSIEDFDQSVQQLKKYNNIKFLEQPFPASDFLLYKEARKNSLLPIIIDETVTSELPNENMREICHGINFKVMKAGGVRRVYQQILMAKKFGFITMVGCMIESTLSISNYIGLGQMTDYADLDGHFFIKDDPFQKIVCSNGELQICE